MKLLRTKINEKISAVIHFPDIVAEKLAILLPGYLDSKEYPHLVALAEDLTERSYTTVRFDPTGTWESDGNIAEYTTSQYLQDIKDVLKYMLGKGNYLHVLLGGHSRGGQVSILYAARDPRISCVLGIMASSGPVTGQERANWAKAGVRVSWRDFPDRRNEKKEFRVSFSYALDMDRYDTAGDAKKIKAPIILAAGELDDVVSPDEVREIYDNANEPKEFLLLAGIGHDYRHNPEEVKRVNSAILAHWMY